ncbi:hypothetical protein AJ88_35310 [Mesorhizobium amorphae CCBAU 01583]|nr:hypothetical protein AJ88_35310 [Mesorhizobium amorphae CCBAU 01583]
MVHLIGMNGRPLLYGIPLDLHLSWGLANLHRFELAPPARRYTRRSTGNQPHLRTRPCRQRRQVLNGPYTSIIEERVVGIQHSYLLLELRRLLNSQNQWIRKRRFQCRPQDIATFTIGFTEPGRVIVVENVCKATGGGRNCEGTAYTKH